MARCNIPPAPQAMATHFASMMAKSNTVSTARKAAQGARRPLVFLPLLLPLLLLLLLLRLLRLLRLLLLLLPLLLLGERSHGALCRERARREFPPSGSAQPTS
jgi:hypothetical protein